MSTNEDVLIREVDEEVAQDRQLAALRRYGPYIAAAAAALLAVVAFWQVRQARLAEARAEASAAYEFALGEDVAAQALFDYAQTVPAEGYRALALMRGASTAARAGERVRAIEAYGQVYADEDLPLALRDLARVRAGYLALEDGGVAADGIVASVTTEAFTPFAQEILGLSALARGEHAVAVAAFERALGERDRAEGGVANRASNYLALARAAQAGVPLEAVEDADDFLDAFGQALREGTLDAGADDAPGTDAEAVDAADPADALTDG